MPLFMLLQSRKNVNYSILTLSWYKVSKNQERQKRSARSFRTKETQAKLCIKQRIQFLNEFLVRLVLYKRKRFCRVSKLFRNSLQRWPALPFIANAFRRQIWAVNFRVVHPKRKINFEKRNVCWKWQNGWRVQAWMAKYETIQQGRLRLKTEKGGLDKSVDFSFSKCLLELSGFWQSG